MRVIDFFDHGHRRSVSGVCLQEGERAYTYDEVAELTHRIAHGLRAAGLARGSRVAVYSPNSALGFAAMLGVFRAGGVWLPVPMRNPEAENAAYLLENSCEFIFFHSRVAAELAQLRNSLPSMRGAVCIDQVLDDTPGLAEWAAGYPAQFPDDDHGGDDLVWIKSTGGTTGRPKSVMVCHRNIEALMASFHACMPLPSPHVNLMAVPMTHGAGNLALASIASGGCVVVLERADPEAILDAIEQHQVTTLFLPPTVIYSLLSAPGVRQRDFSSLRYFVYAAAPMSSDKLRQAIDLFGPVMTQCWGQTEAPLLCTFMAPHEHFENGEVASQRLQSCGRATLLTRVEVMDTQGTLLPDGEMGELVVRGNLVAKGYFNRQQENEAASRFGWHHTGDVGYRDEQGYFYIVDRAKDMIISGGFNIYPSEIEQALWRHPAVLDCAVIGVPDDKWGEAVKAIVELKPDASSSEQELLEHCRAIVGGMKTPKSVEIWPQLPRSNVGKVLKRTIRDRYWQGRERLV